MTQNLNNQKDQIIQALINHAKKEVGYQETGVDHTKYAAKHFPEYQNLLWCDTFVDSMFIEAFGRENAKKMLGGFSSSTVKSKENFERMGTWHSAKSGYVPKPGDQIFFKHGSRGGVVNHTGIVTKVENGIVYTIEGNTTQNRRERNGTKVASKPHALNKSYIIGYGTPNWDVVLKQSIDLHQKQDGQQHTDKKSVASTTHQSQQHQKTTQQHHTSATHNKQESLSQQHNKIVEVVHIQDKERTYKMSDGSIEKRTGGSVSWRNNNPGNLKFEYAGSADHTSKSTRPKEKALQDAQNHFKGVVGLDQFGNAIFESLEAGRNAKIQLLTTNSKYSEHNVHDMLRHYSKADYSGSTHWDAQEATIRKVAKAQGVDLGNKLIKNMSAKEIAALADGIAKFEGFKSGQVDIVQQGKHVEHVSASTHKTESTKQVSISTHQQTHKAEQPAHKKDTPTPAHQQADVCHAAQQSTSSSQNQSNAALLAATAKLIAHAEKLVEQCKEKMMAHCEERGINTTDPNDFKNASAALALKAFENRLSRIEKVFFDDHCHNIHALNHEPHLKYASVVANEAVLQPAHESMEKIQQLAQIFAGQSQAQEQQQITQSQEQNQNKKIR